MSAMRLRLHLVRAATLEQARMIVTLSPAKHRFAGCPCSHAEHTGRGLAALDAVRCAVCEEIEQAEDVVLAIETAHRVARLELSTGKPVKCAGQPHRVVSIEEITKLGGAIATGYVLVKLKVVI